MYSTSLSEFFSATGVPIHKQLSAPSSEAAAWNVEAAPRLPEAVGEKVS